MCMLHENANRKFRKVSANADVKLCLWHSEVKFAQNTSPQGQT